MDHSQHHNMDHAGHHGNVMSTYSTTTMAPDLAAGVHNHHQHQHHHEAMGEQGMMPMHHMMSMAFHFGYTETILFEWWTIDSIGGLLASVAAIFIVAVLYEALIFYRDSLQWKTVNVLKYPVSASHNSTSNVSQNSSTPIQYVEEIVHKQPSQISIGNHIVQTILHTLQVTVSLLLMLIFMTYNVWLCFAVVLGAAVGYFVFRWKKSVMFDASEHCH